MGLLFRGRRADRAMGRRCQTGSSVSFGDAIKERWRRRWNLQQTHRSRKALAVPCSKERGCWIAAVTRRPSTSSSGTVMLAAFVWPAHRYFPALFSSLMRTTISPRSRTRRVGVPILEERLTSAVVASANEILSPGRGRRLFVLQELELGRGRPDVLLVVASPQAIQARARRALRIRTLTEARVLEALTKGNLALAGVTNGHATSIARSLRDRGWLSRSGQVRQTGPVIADSLLLEAKRSHWRKGVSQLTRARFASHKAALLVPESSGRLVPRALLRRNHLGLMVVTDECVPEWVIKAPPKTPSLSADLWITELLVRSVER